MMCANAVNIKGNYHVENGRDEATNLCWGCGHVFCDWCLEHHNCEHRYPWRFKEWLVRVVFKMVG